MRPRSVLLLVYTLEAAGAEKVALALAAGLDRRRFAPVVCAFRGGRLEPAFRALGVPVYVLGKRAGLDAIALARLARVIRRHRVEVLHAHNFSANLWGRVVGLALGVPVRIATEHTMPSIKGPVHRILDRILAPVTTRIVAVSRAVRDAHLRAERLDPARIEVVYNGIDPWDPAGLDLAAYGARLRADLGLPAAARLVTTVGRLEPPKGHEVLLAAAPAILARAPDVRFLLVGDGSRREALEAEARRRGVGEAVVFAGARDDVRPVLAVSTLAVSPSHREGFSITVLEAMSVGTPMVATDVGGNAEAIGDGEGGRIVPPGEPAALAAAVIDLLDDRETAGRLGGQARRRFEARFTVEAMLAGTERLYEAGLAGEAGAPAGEARGAAPGQERT